MEKYQQAQSGRLTAELLVIAFIITVGVVIVMISFPLSLSSPKAGDKPAAFAARDRANESAVIASLRSIYSAESTYAVSDGQGSYATLSTLSSTALIDQRWAGTGAVNGYQYEVILDSTGNKGFCATAERLSDKMGNYSYAISQQCVIYRLAGDSAPSCDPSTGLISTGTPLGS